MEEGRTSGRARSSAAARTSAASPDRRGFSRPSWNTTGTTPLPLVFCRSDLRRRRVDYRRRNRFLRRDPPPHASALEQSRVRRERCPCGDTIGCQVSFPSNRDDGPFPRARRTWTCFGIAGRFFARTCRRGRFDSSGAAVGLSRRCRQPARSNWNERCGGGRKRSCQSVKPHPRREREMALRVSVRCNRNDWGFLRINAWQDGEWAETACLVRCHDDRGRRLDAAEGCGRR